MISSSPFTIYNAAAGAGKTYTLVKAYLVTILKGEFKDSYKNILAITFTNKAVAEMKSRVLENLVAISVHPIPSTHTQLFEDLVQETGMNPSTLKIKADKILKNVLHNYAAFDIVTIDTFTHRVIRTFAHDLGIPMNFDIEMDIDSLVTEAIDEVISDIGINNKLTKVLIDFSLDKLEDDKSWDITIELHKVAKLLFSENDRKHLNALSNKSIEDFVRLKNVLRQKVTRHKKDIVVQSNEVLQLINDRGIDHKDFKGGYIPKYFHKLIKGDLKVDFSKTKWMQDITTTDFYNKTLGEAKKNLIDDIRSIIEESFLVTKNLIHQIHFFENIIKNLIPLSILNTINQKLIEIKKERRILLISEFNTIISDAIMGQPAPFIYERLGEKYRDYFIDEFQDTSEMQWKNLIPLIDNALSSESLSGKRGRLTIVGDAKQAIYRWRGGKAEQLISLSSNNNPFSNQEKQVLNLPKNYRSFKGIVEFNNDLFTFLSEDFSDQMHAKLYKEGNQQLTNIEDSGYVHISFINEKDTDKKNEAYSLKTYTIVLDLIEKGYRPSDICILVRKQKEGVVIADYLTEKGLSVISSETLLINNAPEVKFVVDLLTWYAYPNQLINKINLLHFLAEKYQIKDRHHFLQKMITVDKDAFEEELKQIGINFHFKSLGLHTIYDSVDYIINSFKLSITLTAYLQFFLDEVFAFSQKYAGGVMGFLEYWAHKKDKLSIIAPEEESAIRIMTIHKAKGLEFSCVIYPFANIDIYRELEPKTWYPVEKTAFNNFEEVLINYSKNITVYGEDAHRIVHKRQSQLELDNINLCYVALTRAKEQLYIVSALELNAKGEENKNKFSGKLINYLKQINRWDENQLEYSFGEHIKAQTSESVNKNKYTSLSIKAFDVLDQKYNIKVITNSGKLWDTKQGAAVERGNLIHDLLAEIYTINDVKKTTKEACMKGIIRYSEEEIIYKELKTIVEHPELTSYFKPANHVILNEKEIISKGRQYRPDRVIIKDGVVAVIDYKTGVYSSDHSEQILLYASLLKEMGYTINKKILVYLNEKMTLKYV